MPLKVQLQLEKKNEKKKNVPSLHSICAGGTLPFFLLTLHFLTPPIRLRSIAAAPEPVLALGQGLVLALRVGLVVIIIAGVVGNVGELVPYSYPDA
jgi:hypothetical protein